MAEPNPVDPQQVDAVRAFWYGLINYEQRSPIVADLKLERMRNLLDRLGNPEQRLRIVHTAGTKGKGSTSAMLATVLAQAGYRTGLYTSPHLSRVEERFQINGQPITPDELNPLLDEVRIAALARPEALPTFFEATTAVGFLHFVRRRVDLAVIEVGLGGRLDSTNVCHPLLSIITSISLDHVQILGDRIDQIAREKAGIIKSGRPTISGATDPEARQVIEAVCKEKHSTLRQLGLDFSFEYQPGIVTSSTETRAQLQPLTGEDWPKIPLKLLGEHQGDNATLVVAAVEELRRQGLHIPLKAVEHGLAQVVWPARMEVLSRSPRVILDCSHNVASIRAVIRTLHSSFPGRKRILVFAASQDKDIPGMLHELLPHFQEIYLTRFTEGRRAASTQSLGELVQKISSQPFSIHETPWDAWNAARKQAGTDDVICITGSIFLAGELRPLLLACSK